ncbi:hypothetical protein [Kitasatospora sp. NPDC098663]|uniref:hypothetical protein n=1 Tax=Kitasatospora sp. NPDC098663 TaxID=3364096 RepID=UPI00382DAA4A
MSESPASQRTDDHDRTAGPDDLRVWSAYAVSVTALLHLAAVAVVLSTRAH